MGKLRQKLTFGNLIYVGLLLTFLVCLPRMATTLVAQKYMRTLENVTPHEYAIVLAAEINPDGSPSAVLRDRIQAGVDLYLAGKAQKLVMSGRAPEPAVMSEYAQLHGVPEEDILLDNGGIRTYATCYMADTAFGLEEAIVVTQYFHLPRTIFLCRNQGLEVEAFASVHGRYWRGSTLFWNVRETLATVLAFKEVYLGAPDVNEYILAAQEGDVSND